MIIKDIREVINEVDPLEDVYSLVIGGVKQ